VEALAEIHEKNLNGSRRLSEDTAAKRFIVRWLQLWHARRKRFAEKRFLEALAERLVPRGIVSPWIRDSLYTVTKLFNDEAATFRHASRKHRSLESECSNCRDDFSPRFLGPLFTLAVPTPRFSTLISMKSVAALAAANIVPVERDRANAVSQVRPGDWSIVQTHRELLYYRCKYARTIPLVYPTRRVAQTRVYARTFPRRDKTQSRTDGRTIESFKNEIQIIRRGRSARRRIS
jgi:hypothetical protein